MTKTKPPLWILLLLLPFASIGGVLFTPALPEIARLLDLNETSAQAMMTFYLFGYALGNLLYGPLAKRFGRKPTVYTGIFITILGSLITVMGGKIEMFSLFLLGRFITAVGACVGMKISFTMIADTHKSTEATQKMAFIVLAFAVAPGLSIAMGGFLTMHFGWSSCFYALIAYSLLLLMCSLTLQETAPYLDRKALHLSEVKATYLKKIQNSSFIYASFIMGTAAACIYIFSTLAPFILINYIKITPQQYGLFNFIPPLGLITGSLATYWLAERQERLTTIRLGGKISLLSLLVMQVLILFQILNPWVIFVPITLAYVGVSLAFNNSTVLALEHVEDKSNGSAVMTFISIGTAACAVFISQMILSPVIYEMPIFLIFFSLCQLYFCRRYRLSFSH
jgi:DHA1 family bicyclomycin/chloramphenicol resistance-like MFS transporter